MENRQRNILFHVFQSTLPRGERLCDVCGVWYPFYISIHAPARGATITRMGSHRVQHDFNPRSREGSDSYCCTVGGFLANFNPRSREGSDTSVFNRSVLLTFISIHAPARGATIQRTKFIFAEFISIHAPARGATEWNTYRFLYIQISIHAPARGATGID